MATTYAGTVSVRLRYILSLLMPSWMTSDILSGNSDCMSRHTCIIASNEGITSQRVGVLCAERRCWKAKGTYYTLRNNSQVENLPHILWELSMRIEVHPNRCYSNSISWALWTWVSSWWNQAPVQERNQTQIITCTNVHKNTWRSSRARWIMRRVEPQRVSTSRRSWRIIPRYILTSWEKCWRCNEDPWIWSSRRCLVRQNMGMFVSDSLPGLAPKVWQWDHDQLPQVLKQTQSRFLAPLHNQD